MSSTGKSNFNQALWLGVSQASAFLLAFISSAILSRYFDKADYATYKQVLYVYATLQTVFTAGLPGVFSYFIPRLTLGQGKMLVNKITIIFLILGLLFSILLYFSASTIASVLENPELAKAIKVFSPFPLLTIPTMGVEGIYTALKKTKFIAVYQAISKTAMLVCIVVPVLFFDGTYITAIIGWGTASFITFLVAMWMKARPYVGIKTELIPGMYHAIFNYSLPLMYASLIGMVLHSGNQFFISRHYGTDAFANFSNGFIPLPFVAMVAGSVKSVLLPVFSKAQSENMIDEAVKTYNSAVSQCLVLLYPVLIFCIFYACEIVTLLFSQRYTDSAAYLQISISKDFIEILPYYPVLMAFGKSKVYFQIHLISAIALWLLDFIVVNINLGPHYIAGVSSIVQMAIVISSLLYINLKLKVPVINSRGLCEIVKVFIASFTACVISKFAVGFMDNIKPLISVVIGLFLYIPLLLFIGRIAKINYLTPLRRFVKK